MVSITMTLSVPRFFFFKVFISVTSLIMALSIIKLTIMGLIATLNINSTQHNRIMGLIETFNINEIHHSYIIVEIFGVILCVIS